MGPRRFLFCLAGLGALTASAAWVAAPQEQPDIRVNVEMVQLNVAVTDTKGNYVTGLRPSDFQVSEDGISQKMAMFAAGNEAPKKLADLAPPPSKTQPAGASPASATGVNDAAPNSPAAGSLEELVSP